MKRDERWEKIEASIEPYFPAWEGEEIYEGWEDWLVYFMEVVYNKRVAFARILVHKSDREEEGCEKVILDQMVEMIDRELEQHESRAEAAPAEGG